MERIQRLQNNIAEWSDNTFGSVDRTIGILNHLKEEVQEVIDAKNEYEEGPTGLLQHKMATEFADCLILLLDAARKSDLNTDLLMQAAEYKMKVNRERKWKPANEQGYHKHEH
jgi:NTP pyrophosphatase (non-canonical NTP hydrolase)